MTRLAVLPFLAALILFTGCGARDTAQVSGHVKYTDGSPITGGVRIIRFEPTADATATVRKAASGEIQPDGSFTLFTRQQGDGVYRGKYAVTFTILTKAIAGESLINPIYETSTNTPYVVEVTRNLHDLVFEIERK